MSATESRPKSLLESQLQNPTTAASMAVTEFRGIVLLSTPKKSQCVNSSLHPDTLATQAHIFSLSCFCSWIPSWFGPQQQLLHISLIEPGQLQQGLSSSVQKTFARFIEQVPNRPGARPAMTWQVSGTTCLVVAQVGVRLLIRYSSLSISLHFSQRQVTQESSKLWEKSLVMGKSHIPTPSRALAWSYSRMTAKLKCTHTELCKELVGNTFLQG